MWPPMIRILQHRGLIARLKLSKKEHAKRKSQDIIQAYHLSRKEDVKNETMAGLVEIQEGVKMGKRTLVECVTHNRTIRYVIILTDDISHPAEKTIQDLPDYRIEIIRRDSIVWDKAIYCLVPHYDLFTEEQIKEYEKDHKITRDNLPKMLTTDVAVLLFGFKIGDVVRAVEYDTLRYVIGVEPKS